MHIFKKKFFIRLGVFLLLEKKSGKCTRMLYFWVFFKKNYLKKNPINQSKYSLIPLEGSTTISFLALLFHS